tara:strand:+ start:3499 stop:3633 length:135 start_codon:yes stop_codon:yes gene_type:complete
MQNDYWPDDTPAWVAVEIKKWLKESVDYPNRIIYTDYRNKNTED